MSQFPNQPGGMPPMPGMPMPGGQQPAAGLAIAFMVLGIVSLVAGLIFFYIFIPQIMAIVGIVLGYMAKRSGNTGAAATAGIVLSAIALVWGIVAFIACAACVGCIGCALPGMW